MKRRSYCYVNQSKHLGISKNIMEIRETSIMLVVYYIMMVRILNAIMDKVRPGDMGFDAVHLKLV